MSDLLISGLNNYIDSLLPERDAVLQEMEIYARDKYFPIVGPQVGRFLYQLAYLIKPQRIFEMGSGFGYSAYWFSLAAPQAAIILTEQEDQNIELAKKWFKKGKKDHRVTIKQGRAQDILEKSTQVFDIIFVDVDKHEYHEVFPLALDRVKKGGVILFDNVLWYGKVASHSEKDENTESVRKLNEMLFQRSDVISSIIPIRDGLGLTIKL